MARILRTLKATVKQESPHFVENYFTESWRHRLEAYQYFTSSSGAYWMEPGDGSVGDQINAEVGNLEVENRARFLRRTPNVCAAGFPRSNTIAGEQRGIFGDERRQVGMRGFKFFNRLP